MQGKKFDSGKLDWSLLPLNATEEIIKILMLGRDKYGAFNWKYVKPFKKRYYNALMRHITAWYKGEKVDSESGLNPLSHAGCCLLFLLEMDLIKEKK